MKNSNDKDRQVDTSAYRDSCKLFFDFYKHVTTLSIGSIVLLITIFAKLEGEILESDYLLNAIISFIITIIACLVAMYASAGHIQGRKELQDVGRNTILVSTIFVGGGLLFGLGALYFFAKSNI